MKAKTMEGREIDLKQETLNGLKMRLRGPMFTPGDVGYDESRTVWNGMIDKRPAVVVRCLGTADVITCVQFAREHELLLCLKGGGHNIAGLAAADGALMLDMSLMRGVWVDPQRKVARAQAGCLLGDVDRETQVHGLAAVLGFVSLTGIAGLTLGGGFGYLTRRWGWTADNVAGMDVVTADARLVHAGSDENADLFWGLRGGGGNFGVVTGIDYVLHPVGPEVVGGVVAWPASAAPKVLELCEKLIDHAAKIRSPHSSIGLMHIGGALNSLNDDHSPVGNRDAHYVLNLAGSWEQAGEDRANIEWAREAWHDIKSFSTGGTYINFLTEDEGPERTKAALGKGLQRLAEVKARWDPENIFRTNRNIKPV